MEEGRKNREGRRKESQGGRSRDLKTSDLLYSPDCFPSHTNASRKQEANSFMLHTVFSWRKKAQSSHQGILHGP